MYVFDTSAFIMLFSNYYRNRFPTLWQLFDKLVDSKGIVSTREALREIKDRDGGLYVWANDHKELFPTPTANEGAFVAEIYAIPHFQHNIEKQKILQGGRNADPFVIATARVAGRKVVTGEKMKDNAAKIPSICKHFDIPCLTLEEFMESEGWEF